MSSESSSERKASKDVVRFPRIPGQVRTLIVLSRCTMCEKDVGDYESATFMAYNGEPTCLAHAELLKRMQEKQGDALGALADLDRRALRLQGGDDDGD